MGRLSDASFVSGRLTTLPVVYDRGLKDASYVDYSRPHLAKTQPCE